MVEFLRKFENRAIKSCRDNSIHITKIYQFAVIFKIFKVLGVRCDVDIFKLTASVHPIYWEYIRHSIHHMEYLFTHIECSQQWVLLVSAVI